MIATKELITASQLRDFVEFPFGWLHLLKARYFNDKAAFYLIGIKPKILE